MRRLLSLLAGVGLTLSVAASADLQTIPDLHARVTDRTATLSSSEQGKLEDALFELEQRKGAQLVVLLVPTTQPETIEQYATRAFEEWKIGRKKIDDGVLLLVAKNDRRLRIEVGRGLEGVIPDAVAARIIRDYVVPRFMIGDFYSGIRGATDALTLLVDGEPLPESRNVSGRRSNELGLIGLSPVAQWLMLLLMSVGLGAIWGYVLGRFIFFFLQPRIRAPIIAVLAAVGIHYTFGNPAFPAQSLALTVLGALACGMFALIPGMPHGGGGGGSSGGSSSGGFSGGGGSSAGGGASGSW